MYSLAKIEDIVSNRCWIEGEFFQLKLNASFWITLSLFSIKVMLSIKSLLLLPIRYILALGSIKVSYSCND